MDLQSRTTVAHFILLLKRSWGKSVRYLNYSIPCTILQVLERFKGVNRFLGAPLR